jgi:small subunit ribosomal protein S17
MSEQKASMSPERSARKVREGLVVSDKMDKTVVVAVEDRVKHPLYGKVAPTSSRRTTRPTRPVSATASS